MTTEVDDLIMELQGMVDGVRRDLWDHVSYEIEVDKIAALLGELAALRARAERAEAAWARCAAVAKMGRRILIPAWLEPNMPTPVVDGTSASLCAMRDALDALLPGDAEGPQP